MSHDDATHATAQPKTRQRIRASALALLVASALAVASSSACVWTGARTSPAAETSVTVISSAVDSSPLSPEAGSTLPGKPGYRIAFDEEFSGRTLDTRHWAPGLAWGTTNRDEQQRYVPQALSVGDGMLSIWARKTDTPKKPYTSGALSSLAAFQFKYGYAEIRARVPAGAGLWSAFWLLAHGAGLVDEIDVMEVIGSDPGRSYQVLHYGTAADKQRTLGSFRGPDLSAGFHTFAVDWRADSLVWYVDGVQRFRTTEHVPQEPMYLVTNLAVGSATSWSGAPDTHTVFPARYDIDYIRVYQR